MKLNKQNKVLIGILGVVVVLFIIFNFSDSMFGNLGGETAEIELFVPEETAVVYMDGQRLQVTGEKDSTIDVKDLRSGTHEIIVAKEGFWPWSKEVELEGGDTFEARAFLVRAGSQGIELSPGNAEYTQAQSILAGATLPDEDSKLAHTDSRVRIWTDGDDIFAEWAEEDDDPESFFCVGSHCSKRSKVLSSDVAVKGLDFYQDREDVLVFATGDRIYAIEIDRNGTQNLQPLYEGADLSFAKASDEFLYVRDNGKIFKVAM